MPNQEMIDRVAEAIYNNWANYPACSASKSWLELCEVLPGQANDFRRKAKAAIKAMREPTDSMLNGVYGVSARQQFTDMLDEVLE